MKPHSKPSGPLCAPHSTHASYPGADTEIRAKARRGRAPYTAFRWRSRRHSFWRISSSCSWCVSLRSVAELALHSPVIASAILCPPADCAEEARWLESGRHSHTIEQPYSHAASQEGLVISLLLYALAQISDHQKVRVWAACVELRRPLDLRGLRFRYVGVE